MVEGRMTVDKAGLATRLLVAAIFVVLVAGVLGTWFETLRVVAFLVFAVAGVVALWSASSLVRAFILQSARLARTERRVGHAREESEQRAKTFSNLIEGLRVMLIVVDDKFDIVAANKAARKAFDFANPVGESLLGVTHSHELEQLAGLAAKSATRLRDELTLPFPNEARVRVYAWRNSAVEGQVFISILDVTELRRLQTVRKDFVANVSHELRTPMTTIRAMAETMLDGSPEDKELTERYLEKIIREV